MNRDGKQLQARAKAKLARIKRKRRDPRYVRTMAKLVVVGLLQTNITGLPTSKGRLALGDALFAGTVEPRVLELLPAIILKRPRLLALPDDLPEDIAKVLRAIAAGKDLPDFRGVAPAQYLPWVARIGRPGHGPAVLRSFRLRHEDVQRLGRLRERLQAKSQTEVLRTALRMLEQLLDAEQQVA